MRRVLAVALFGVFLAQSPAQGSEDANDPYASARKLAAAGFEKEARALAVKIAGEKPSVRPIPESLRPGRLDEVHDFLAPMVQSALGAVTLLALAVCVGLLLRKLWWSSRPGRKRYAGVVVAEIAAPAENARVAARLRALVTDELDVVASPASRFTVPSVGGADLPSLLELPEPVRFLGPFVAWLRRPPHLRISGTLHLDEEVCGVSVEISTHKGTVLNRRHFGADGRPCASALELLAVDVAAWCAFELQEHRHHARSWSPFDDFGTRHWASYAAVRKARRTEGERSDRFCRRALALDPRNVFALLVIGTAESRKYQEADVMKRGIQRLVFATETMKRSSRRRTAPWSWPRGTQIDSRWYQVQYALAVSYLHRSSVLEEDPQDAQESANCLREGLKLAVELARAVGSTHLAITSWLTRSALNPREGRALRGMLELDARRLLGIVAGAKASQEVLAGGLETVDGKSLKTLTDGEIWSWLAGLDAAKLPAAQVLHAALSDEFESGETLYNGACFHAQAREFDQALQELGRSFEFLSPEEQRSLIEWATQDPTLAGLRSKRQQEFGRLSERVLARCGAGPGPNEDPIRWAAEPSAFARLCVAPR